jgi:hypothetical protein
VSYMIQYTKRSVTCRDYVMKTIQTRSWGDYEIQCVFEVLVSCLSKMSTGSGLALRDYVKKS